MFLIALFLMSCQCADALPHLLFLVFGARSVEESAMDSFRRADFDALSTVDASILVDDCEVVFDLDGVDGAGAHTTAAGDAPDLAGVPHDFRGPVIGARDVRRELVLGNQTDQLFRASFDAFAACGAKIVVHLSDAVFDVDRVEFADVDAVAETEAPKCTGIRSGEESVRRCAVRCSRVFVSFMRVFARPLAEDVRNEWDYHSRLDAERCGDSRRCILTARRAECCVFLGFVGEGGRVGGTTAIATASAVHTGEDALKLFLKRIFLHAEIMKDNENDGAHQERDASANESSAEDGIE